MSDLLETERLLLRPPRAADISHFLPLINDFDVSKNLSRVPYPYTEDDGCAFIVAITRAIAVGTDHVFAILIKPDVYIGTCGLHPERGWELGYWLGKPYWGQGYATEAGGRVVAYAFEELNADALTASWFHDNPKSGRVLAKLGFQPVGEGEIACLSRGCAVNCHRVALDRATYMTRKMVS
jgi:[ribosomal protein S5]-alanine N-acetyltransferase